MVFDITVRLGNVSVDITHVSVFGCTGGNCNNCTPLPNYQNIPVSSFPLEVKKVPSDVDRIKLVTNTTECGTQLSECISFSKPPLP